MKNSNIKFSDFQNKKINMHTHTTRCQHAKGADREYVEKAIEAGYDVLGFSDHAPYLMEDGYVSPIRMGMHQLEDYVTSIHSLKAEYKKDIEIYCGLEMEYFPEYFDKTMKEIDCYPIEYMILGQHFYDGEAGWISPKRPWEDEEHLKMYIDRVMAGLATERFFYVAHPDIMCFSGPAEIYKKHMTVLAQEFKKRNMPIELNINGFRDKLHYPNPLFIEIGLEVGNDFIIGVDAHSPKNLLEFDVYESCKKLVTDRGGKVVNCVC